MLASPCRAAARYGRLLARAQLQALHTSAAQLLAAPVGSESPGFSNASPLRVAVVGAGPAGCYTVDRLLHRFGDAVRVDLLERLPAPFGLVRYGVAPDHGATSSPVADKFTRLVAHPAVRLLCGAAVGDAEQGGVPVSLLRRHYHAVVLAVGAPGHRALRIPGESTLGNVCPARDFVAWYNGHPEFSGPPPVDLRAGRHAVIIGLGNVALDCARLLLRDPSSLAGTDMPSAVVAAFAQSTIRHVTLIARRSAAHVAATPKELREVLNVPGVRCRLEHAELDEGDAAQLEAGPRPHRRALDELLKASARDSGNAAADAGGDKTLTVLFKHSPVEVLSAPGGHVTALRLRANVMSGPSGARVASLVADTARDVVLPADVVLTSVGYRGLPIDTGVPFDAATGTIPHVGGAVVDPGAGDAPVAGLFAVGWCKRGATGIIGTNLTCAEDTVATLAEHAQAGRLHHPAEATHDEAAVRVLQALTASGAKVLSAHAWAQLDAAERTRGAERGKPREKVTALQDMLAFADR